MNSKATILDRNLETLRAVHPSLADSLSRSSDSPDFELKQRSASTFPDAIYSTRRLHSRPDPIREAKRTIGTIQFIGHSRVIMYGMGMGYRFRALREVAPEMPVVVYEPDRALLRSILGAADLRDILVDSRLSFVVGAGPEAIRHAAEDAVLRDALLIANPAVAGAHEAGYRQLAGMLQQLKQKDEINRNTLKRFGRLWVRNLVRNRQWILKGKSLEQIRDAARGMPMLLLAAGPSLSLVDSVLSELASRMLVVAVDTAMGHLERLGASADVAVIVDPQYWNTRHLDSIAESSALLVSESSTHPRVFRRFSASPFFCESLFPLGRFLERSIGVQGQLGAGGSVATTAWDLGRFLGVSEIYCAGLDLGFPDMQTHVHGSFFEERAHTLSSRRVSVESMSVAYMYEAGPQLVPNNTGTETLTDKRMQLYRWWFEARLSEASSPPTYNLSPRGVAIHGMPFAPIERLLRLPVLRTEPHERLLPVDEPEATHIRDKRFDSHVRMLAEELRQLKRCAQNGIAAVVRIRAEISGGGPASLALLDEVDKSISALPNREVAGFLMQDALEQVQGARGTDIHGMLENAMTIYRSLLESVSYHEAEIRELLAPTAGD